MKCRDHYCAYDIIQFELLSGLALPRVEEIKLISRVNKNSCCTNNEVNTTKNKDYAT